MSGRITSVSAVRTIVAVQLINAAFVVAGRQAALGNLILIFPVREGFIPCLYVVIRVVIKIFKLFPYFFHYYN